MLFLRGEASYHVITMKAPSRAEILYDRPGTYHICVQGAIDPSWSDRLEGMKIHLSAVEGELSDQAALAGVLNSLYELHLPILLVMLLNVEKPFSEKQSRTIALRGNEAPLR